MKSYEFSSFHNGNVFSLCILHNETLFKVPSFCKFRFEAQRASPQLVPRCGEYRCRIRSVSLHLQILNDSFLMKNHHPVGGDFSLLFREEPVDEGGGQDDQADDHEDHQHAHAHTGQLIHKTHGVKIEIHNVPP